MCAYFVWKCIKGRLWCLRFDSMMTHWWNRCSSQIGSILLNMLWLHRQSSNKIEIRICVRWLKYIYYRCYKRELPRKIGSNRIRTSHTILLVNGAAVAAKIEWADEERAILFDKYQMRVNGCLYISTLFTVSGFLQSFIALCTRMAVALPWNIWSIE